MIVRIKYRAFDKGIQNINTNDTYSMEIIMNQYCITHTEAKQLSKRLKAIGTPDSLAAARLIDNNWHSVAARPAVVSDMCKLAN